MWDLRHAELVTQMESMANKVFGRKLIYVKGAVVRLKKITKRGAWQVLRSTQQYDSY
jgi:hypothetical protein